MFRAMIRDVFDKKQLSKVGALLGMLIGFIPAVAPTIGGYVQSYFGWRANFVMLLMIITFAFVWVLTVLPETNRELTYGVIHLRALFHNYWALISNKRFIIFPICSSLAFSGIMVYVTISPFVFQNVIGLTPIQYGWLAFVIGAGILTGSFTNAILLKRFEPESILLYGGGTVMVLASASMLVFGLLGYINVWVIMIPMFFFIYAIQLAFSNMISVGLSMIGGTIGFASALFSSIQVGGASIISSLAALVHVSNQIPMALFLLGLSVAFFLLQYWVSGRKVESVLVLSSRKSRSDKAI